MEMTKYIMSIFKTQLMVVWSWGFNSPMAVKNGLRFKVQGFKFRGIVEVLYNEGSDLFDVSFIKAGKVIKTIDGIFFDMLVETIDNYVEKTSDYEEKVKAEYSLTIIMTDQKDLRLSSENHIHSNVINVGVGFLLL